MSKAVAVIGRFWRAEADDAAAVAEAMRLDGNDAAAVETLGHGALVALGPGRYVNRAIGVGPDLEDGHIEVIERFFSHRGLRAGAQLTSWASSATLGRLAARGYRPQWFRSVFAAALPEPGQSSALYAYASTGTVTDGLVGEILGFEGSRGAAVVLMSYTDGSDPNTRDNPVKLVFYVPDPAAFADAIRADGLAVTREPAPVPELGDTVVGFAEDPDGYTIEILAS